MFPIGFSRRRLLNQSAHSSVAYSTASKLRQPRPMEGIYHAAFVSARMVLAGKAVLAFDSISALMTSDEQMHLRRQIDNARNAFADAAEVVQKHVRLTAFGAEAMDNARAFVLQAALRSWSDQSGCSLKVSGAAPATALYDLVRFRAYLQAVIQTAVQTSLEGSAIL